MATLMMLAQKHLAGEEKSATGWARNGRAIGVLAVR
jgi:hypothetical protein